MKLTRKEFLRGSLAAAGGALGLGMAGAGCGGDDDGGGGGNAGGCSSSIESNHGHALSVSPADVDAGTDKTYAIQGSSPHSHDVTVTAAHFGDLKAGKQVFVTTTDTAGHNHNISVKCA